MGVVHRRAAASTARAASGASRVVARVARAGAVCLVTALVTAGCTSARSNLGTSASPCFSALPSAIRAAGEHAHLVSVHLVTLKQLEHVAPMVFHSLDTGQGPRTRVCAIVFAGRFTSHSVERPRGRPSGTLAVTVLDTPSNQVVGTVIFRHPVQQLGPRHFMSF